MSRVHRLKTDTAVLFSPMATDLSHPWLPTMGSWSMPGHIKVVFNTKCFSAIIPSPDCGILLQESGEILSVEIDISLYIKRIVLNRWKPMPLKLLLLFRHVHFHKGC